MKTKNEKSNENKWLQVGNETKSKLKTTKNNIYEKTQKKLVNLKLLLKH